MPKWSKLKEALSENSEMRAIKLYISSSDEELDKNDILAKLKDNEKQRYSKKKLSVRIGK